MRQDQQNGGFIWLYLDDFTMPFGLILPYNASNHVIYEFKGQYIVGVFHMLKHNSK